MSKALAGSCAQPRLSWLCPSIGWAGGPGWAAQLPTDWSTLVFQKSFQGSKLLVLSAQTLPWLQGLHPALLCSHS